MPYQSDYVLRLIEEIGALVRHTLERVGAKSAEESSDVAGRAIGLALDMDPATASMLSPESLAALVELGRVDPRVRELVSQAIEAEADLCEAGGRPAEAVFRRDQAAAVRTPAPPARPR